MIAQFEGKVLGARKRKLRLAKKLIELNKKVRSLIPLLRRLITTPPSQALALQKSTLI